MKKMNTACLKYFIAYIKQLPSNTHIKTKNVSIDVTFSIQFLNSLNAILSTKK